MSFGPDIRSITFAAVRVVTCDVELQDRVPSVSAEHGAERRVPAACPDSLCRLAVGDAGMLSKVVESLLEGAVREYQAQKFAFTRGVACVQSANSGYVGCVVQLAAAGSFVTGAIRNADAGRQCGGVEGSLKLIPQFRARPVHEVFSWSGSDVYTGIGKYGL